MSRPACRLTLPRENMSGMNNRMKHGILATFALICLALVAAVQAQSPIPAPPGVSAESYVLVDFESGRMLIEENADMRVEPASITKIMTAYAVFSELRGGDISLDDEVVISENAWRTPGSRMFVEVGTKVTVEQLLEGMIIQSGNDASVALAEHVAGSEDAFAGLMNHYGEQLGLTDTHFMNATGLPDPEHYTTARDVAVLSRAMIAEFPDYYTWFAEKEYTYNGIRQHNRNSLLWRDPAVDGLKTGHTESAGYCLATSAKREGMRLISVLMGANSEKQRADDSQALLNYGFRFFESHRLYGAGKPLKEFSVWKGEAETVPAGVRNNIHVAIPRGRYEELEATMELDARIVAPVAEGDELGTLRVTLDGEVLAESALVALQAVPRGGWWTRMSDSVKLWFAGDEDDE